MNLNDIIAANTGGLCDERQDNGYKHCSNSYRHFDGELYVQYSDHPTSYDLQQLKRAKIRYKLITIPNSLKSVRFKRLYVHKNDAISKNLI